MRVSVYDVRFERKGEKLFPGNYGFAIVVARSREQAQRTFESDTVFKVAAMSVMVSANASEPDFPFRPAVVYLGKLYDEEVR